MRKIVTALLFLALTFTLSANDLSPLWSQYQTNNANRMKNLQTIISIQSNSITKYQTIISIQSNQMEFLLGNVKEARRESLILKIIVALFTGISIYGLFRTVK